MLWLIPPIVIAGGILVVGRRARANGSADTGTGENDDRPDTEVDFPVIETGRVDVRELALSIGAPSIWADFFDVTAYGESGGNPNVGLGIKAGAPSWAKMNISQPDANASARAYDRSKGWLQRCWTPEAYSFGSGGLFQMFAANALAAFKTDPIYSCNHPWSIFDPRPAMIYAAWMAYRLQQWKQWLGTVQSMRMAWANPSKMGEPPTAAKRAKWERHCDARGLPASFLDERLPRWKPKPARELWDRFELGASWLSPAKAIELEAA